MIRVSAGLLVFIFGVLLSPLAHAQQNQGTVPPNVFGSVTQGNAVPGTISLSITDAIDRALKYNLGSAIAEQDSRVAAAERLRSLSELLPKINATVSETYQQIDLAAFGFTSFPGVPSVVGPFTVSDVRVHYSQPALDMKLVHDFRANSERLTASNLAQQDVREFVVLVTTDLYLEAVAGASRVDAAQAQLKTAQAVYDRALDMKNSGVIPGIDLLRSQVQLQTEQQRLLAVENDLAKQRLNLARAIGLPQGQAFSQTDSFATSSAAVPPLEEAMVTAMESRPDYRRAQALVRAAEESRKAATSRRLPSVGFYADYGDIGQNPWNSHGTATIQTTLLVPIYTGERTKAEVMESEGVLEQRKAEAANLKGRIEYELRIANLDIRTVMMFLFNQVEAVHHRLLFDAQRRRCRRRKGFFIGRGLLPCPGFHHEE